MFVYSYVDRDLRVETFTNRGCLHCAILKTYNARDMIFKISKMFKDSMKFTKAALLNELKNKQQRQKHHTYDILILSLLLVILMV